MHPLVTLLIVGTCLLGSLGCAPIAVIGHVNSASYEPLPGNASFTVIGSRIPSLTEKQVQDLITTEMVSLGFKRATDPEQADVAVVYDVSVGQGRAFSSPDFVWGGQAVSTYFPRQVRVSLIDVKQSREKKQAVIGWQGEIYSEGSVRNVGWIAEQFIPELFKRFGQSTNNEPFFQLTTAPIF